MPPILDYILVLMFTNKGFVNPTCDITSYINSFWKSLFRDGKMQ